METHLGEQLQALHYHTNNITRTRNQLDQLFEGRIHLIRREEEARLQEMARIYENLLLPDQPDGPAVVRQILRANLTEDPTLNGKVFQYLAPTNQALVFRTLLSGDTSDPELYQNLIQHHRKTMKLRLLILNPKTPTWKPPPPYRNRPPHRMPCSAWRHPPAVQVMPSSSTRFLKMPPRK